MKLSIMREFVKLAEEQNFSRAAEKLYMAQPVLSRHISQLENELHAKLVNRTRSSFELTPAGELMRNEFSDILHAYSEALEKLAQLEGTVDESLSLGFLYYDRAFYVAKLRDEFRHRYPQVDLVMHSYQPADLERDLLDGKIDAAFVYGTEGCMRSDIERFPFLKVPYTLIVSKEHRLAGLDDVSPEYLNGERLLRPTVALEVFRSDIRLSSMLEENGVQIAGIVPIQNFDEVPWLLRDTGAVCISPMVNPGVYGNEVHAVTLPERYRTDVSLVWRSDCPNKAINLLCNVIRICYP